MTEATDVTDVTESEIDDGVEATYSPITGKARQFSAREAPWMMVGTVIDAPVTSEVAARMAGMDFEIELLDAGFRDGPAPEHGDGDNAGGVLSAEDLAKLADDVKNAGGGSEALRKFGRRVPELLAHIAKMEGGTGQGSNWSTVLNRRAVVRRDTREHFDFVSADYVPVQYAEAFSFMDKVSPHVVAAGTLMGGRQGFMVVQSPALRSLDFELNGESDPHELFTILRTSHNRSRGLEVINMPLRGRCMNQLPLASFGRGENVQRWAIRHVGDPRAKLLEAEKVFANLTQYADEYERMVRNLADTKVLLDDAKTILETVLPDRPRREQQVAAIVDAWQHSPTVGFTDNGWGLVNGVGEYFEWQRETGVRTDQSRFIGGVDGITNKYVNRTAQLLLRRR